MLHRRAKVREHQLSALLLGVLAVARHDFVAGAVHAAARLSLDLIRVDQPHVHGRLAPVAHDDEHVVLALFRRPLAGLDNLGPLGELLHVGFLRRGFFEGNRRPAPALDLRQREFSAVVFLGERSLDVVHRHRVAHLVEHLEQLGRVHERGHARRRLEALCARLLHPHLLDAGEGVGPRIERREAQRLHLRRHQVAHHVVHLGQRVRHRRAGGGHKALVTPVLGEDLPDLEQHVVGALAAGGVAKPLHVLHLRAEHQVLEQVKLVHKQLIDAQLVEVQQVVHRTVAQRLDAVLQPLLQSLQLFDRAALLLLVRIGVRLHRFNGRDDLGDLLAVELFLKLWRGSDEAERRVRNDDRVPVAGGRLRQEFAPVLALEVVLGGRQDVGARV